MRSQLGMGGVLYGLLLAICLMLQGTPPIHQNEISPTAKRTFGPTGPVPLIKAGDCPINELLGSSRTSTSFSFSFKELYRLSLYLDETEARRELARFRGRSLAELLAEDNIHRAISESEFPKVLVFSFPRDTPSQVIQGDLNRRLLYSPAYGTSESVLLINFFNKTLKPIDEVVICFVGNRLIAISPKHKKPLEIIGPRFARALLALWIGKDKESGYPAGLLREIGILLQ